MVELIKISHFRKGKLMIAKCCKFVVLNCVFNTFNSSVIICTFTSCLGSENI